MGIRLSMPPLTRIATASSGDGEDVNADGASGPGESAELRESAEQDLPNGEVVEISDSELDEDEYEVDKILEYRMVKGRLKYLVKWEGFEQIEDQTWEPEMNLYDATEALDAFHESIGGHPRDVEARKRRRSTATERTSKRAKKEAKDSAPPSSTRRTIRKARTRKNSPPEKDEETDSKWSPPTTTSWENHVMAVDTIEEYVDPKEGRNYKVYLAWNNGKRTFHPISVTRKMCPQKMIDYFVQHLVFDNARASHSASQNGVLCLNRGRTESEAETVQGA